MGRLHAYKNFFSSSFSSSFLIDLLNLIEIIYGMSVTWQGSEENKQYCQSSCTVIYLFFDGEGLSHLLMCMPSVLMQRSFVSQRRFLAWLYFKSSFQLWNHVLIFLEWKKSSFVSILHTSLDISVLCQSIYLWSTVSPFLDHNLDHVVLSSHVYS